MHALILHPVLPAVAGPRTPEAMLEEAVSLARALPFGHISGKIIPLRQPRPAAFFGSGRIEALATDIQAEEIGLVVVNHTLSPVQQRNLEKAWDCKVIDRTALILEIFGERARTREGRLQVELASLNYQKSRLVRSWTHLERQRGGFGFLGGPGETQIESDRRMLRDRIALIRRQLEKVVRTRGLHRKIRHDVPYPLVALAGYTNAGKSTLFNRLTGASVVAEDVLFATLDPTIRKITLPSGRIVLLSDTVGFISDLPTELVAAFRATLEEVREADVILHIRDASHPDTQAQKQDVDAILNDLLAGLETPRLEVLNKMDQLEDTILEAASAQAVPISALTGEGMDALLERMDAMLAAQDSVILEYAIDAGDGAALAWLHAHGQVVDQSPDGGTVRVRARLSPENRGRFERRFHQEMASIP